ERGNVIRALELGARGIVLKGLPSELLFKGIRSVMAGQYWVGRDTISDLVETLVRLQKSPPATQNHFGPTRRELGLLTLVVHGYTNRDVAAELRITEDTVKHH